MLFEDAQVPKIKIHLIVLIYSEFALKHQEYEQPPRSRMVSFAYFLKDLLNLCLQQR